MVAINVYPGSLQWLGLAKETTYGTPAAAPTIFIPLEAAPKYDGKPTILKDAGLRGAMGTAVNAIQGQRYDELSYKCLLFADSIYPHFINMLGQADTTTGSADPYTHKTSLLNGTGQAQPASYTGWLYLAGGKAVQIPGMMLADLKLTMKPNEKASLDADWWGLPGTIVTAPTYTATTLKPYNTNNLTISVGGTQTTAVSDIEIDFKRDTKMALGFTGTQSPVSIFMGACTVTGTMQAIFQGATDQFLTDLFNNTQPVVTASIYADGDTTHPFTVQMSKCVFNSATPQGSMTSYMTISAPFEALLNPTDALDGNLSPAQVKILTSTSTLF